MGAAVAFLMRNNLMEKCRNVLDFMLKREGAEFVDEEEVKETFQIARARAGFRDLPYVDFRIYCKAVGEDRVVRYFKDI